MIMMVQVVKIARYMWKEKSFISQYLALLMKVVPMMRKARANA